MHMLFGLLLSGGAPAANAVVDVATAGLVVAIVVNYTKWAIRDLAVKARASDSDQTHLIQLYVWIVALAITLLSMLQDGTLTGNGIAQNVEPILATSLMVAGVAIGTYSALSSDSTPAIPASVAAALEPAAKPEAPAPAA